jgi:hypothetical protein
MSNHISTLKAAVMNEAAYTAAVAELRASNPARTELAHICRALTQYNPGPRDTIVNIYERIERYGHCERRHAARAAVSRRVMPI